MRSFVSSLPFITLCSLPLITQAANAQNTPAAKKPAIEHVFVTVPRHRLKEETALAVSVISGQELANQKASTLGETLQFKPGLASTSFGPGVGQPIIRGQQGARVLSLQNSTISNDAARVSGDHAVSIEPLLAEKIEVIRGPAALLYGSGAIGGVVNVIDKRVPVRLPNQTELKGEYRYNSVNEGNTLVLSLDTGIATQNGGWAFHLSGVDREGNDFDTPDFTLEDETVNSLENTQTDAQAFTLGTSYLTEESYIGFSYSEIDNFYGIPVGAHGHEEEHDEAEGEEHDEEEGHDEEEEETVSIDLEQKRYDIRADIHEPLKYIEKVRWFLTHTDYMHTELEGDEIGTVWANDSTENRFEILHEEIGGWHGALGLQVNKSSLSAVGEEAYIPATDTRSQGIFILEDKHVGAFKFELGARFESTQVDLEDGSVEKDFSSRNFSASGLYSFNDAMRLGVALSHSQRAPVAEELFSNNGLSEGDFVEHVATGTIEVGDDNLDVERSNNIDISFSFNLENTEGYITVFNNQFSDYIYLEDTGREQDEVAIFEYNEIGADFNGIEFEVTQNIGNTALTVFGDSINGELDNGLDVPRLTPQKVGFKVNYTQPLFNVHAAVMHGFEAKENGIVNTQSFNRLDATVNFTPFKEKGNVLFLQATNLTDELIRNNTSFLREIAPEPGRAVKVGLRFSL